MIIQDTYNGNEILRKYNNIGDTYKMYRVYICICARPSPSPHTHTVFYNNRARYKRIP